MVASEVAVGLGGGGGWETKSSDERGEWLVDKLGRGAVAKAEAQWGAEW